MRVGTNLTQSRSSRSFRTAASVLLALSVCLAGHRSSAPRTTSAIVQSTSLAQASALVRGVGGTVTHELGIIDAVAANLTPSQLSTIKGQPGIRLYGDSPVLLVADREPGSLIAPSRYLEQAGFTVHRAPVAEPAKLTDEERAAKPAPKPLICRMPLGCGKAFESENRRAWYCMPCTAKRDEGRPV
jgi:hypothetical protein